MAAKLKLQNSVNSHLFLFSEISEGPDKIIFHPPGLSVLAFWGGDIKSGFAILSYDFGMEVKTSFEAFFCAGLETVEAKIARTIEFDLFHAFFHCKDDPNYSTLHWALYGNLKSRATLFEGEIS